ncbi:hypothetical protein H8356DRAFT_1349556 [Neocallimastix lanati (nom. inval.)]|nr:hypothetical protein H8356DRAFT_1349556 [Neocallimastix sp. JGI-2020a]
MSVNSSSNSSSSGHGFLDFWIIGKLHRDGKIWKIRIDACFQREGVVTDEDKFNYFIAAAEDDIVILLREKKIQLKRSLTVDECVEKDYKLRELKRVVIEPNESDRGAISIIDYENALRPRSYIYEKVAMAEADSMMKACSLAEKDQDIEIFNNPSLNYNYYSHNSSRNAFNIDRTNCSNRNEVKNNNLSTHEPGKYNSNNDDRINDLINRMQTSNNQIANVFTMTTANNSYEAIIAANKRSRDEKTFVNESNDNMNNYNNKISNVSVKYNLRNRKVVDSAINNNE